MVKKLNIVSDEEKNELLNFAIDSKHLLSNSKTLKDGLLIDDYNRKISPSYGLVFPQVSFVIQQRIREIFICLKDDFDRFQNGMVIGLINPPGDFYPHTDINYKKNGLSVVGFNLLLSQPEGGGILTVNGNKYEMISGDMMAYPITDYEHGVSAIAGNKPRIMWHWRFYCDLKDWESQV